MTNAPAKILVTFDGSDSSRAVFEPAARLAKRLQASIVLLRVYQAPGKIWVHPDSAFRESELARLHAEWSEQLATDASAFSAAAGIAVEPACRVLGKRWNVAGEILAVADEFDVELICMATHGESSIRHFFVGSTALDVLSQSRRPVTLIRVAEDE